jgi:glycosyltransferase involved in cell wall biosynthesis
MQLADLTSIFPRFGGDSMHVSKRVLIVAQGPVPTPEQSHVEGGGLRAWGLAKGMRKNSRDLDVSIAFDECYRKPEHTSEIDGIRIDTWNHQTISSFVRQYDSVVMSYCTGEISVRVAESMRPDQQLILDCYVPIFVEYSARDSADLDREFHAYVNESKLWTRTLLRGDYFLCANAAQERYYQGVLSALGRINPLTYHTPMLMRVPYGIHREEPRPGDRPITRILGDRPARKVLWFGGLYPWFDSRRLVDAVALVNQRVPTRLVMVGAKNPFTTHPVFLANYQDQIAYTQLARHKDLVIMQDWVHFDQRADWYLDADLIVMVNKPGVENSLSWRTRLVDYTWANVPIVTNGGDPLSEELLAASAAARFDSLDPGEMARTLGKLLEDPGALATIKENLAAFRTKLFWDVLTEPLTRAIEEGGKAPDLVLDGLPKSPKVSPVELEPYRQPPARIDPIPRLVNVARNLPAYVRRHGLRATAWKIRNRLERRIRHYLPERVPPEPRIVVLAHRLDLSGAPYVLMDVLAHTVDRGLGEHVHLFTHPPVHYSNVKQLAELGLKTNHLPHLDAVPTFVPGDVVLLNTVAFSPKARATIMDAIQRGIVTQVTWYVHEDDPNRFFTRGEADLISRLIRDQKIVMFAPSQQTCEHYRSYFGVDIRREPYRVDLPRKYHQVRDADDFNTLRFILSGTFLDGRKGQHVVLYALAAFYRQFFQRYRARYREFNLTFAGVEEDWYSQQVLHHQGVLGDRLIVHPKMTREPCLDLIREANMTVCYSLSETMGIFVFEGMLAGHPILRNDCSGIDEQLEEGENGYRLDTNDYWQVVETFERVLNRRKTSNEQLAAMSARSHTIALAQREHRYSELVGQIQTSFRGTRQPPSRPHSRPIRDDVAIS